MIYNNNGHVKAHVNYRRSRYMVNAPMQVRFIASAILAGESVVLVTLLSGYYIIRHMLDVYASPAITMVADDILMPSLFYTMLGAGIICAVIMGLWGLLFSHRIAGPMYRLERICKRLSDGDLTIRVGFRRKDMLRPLKDTVQGMIVGLRERVGIVRDSHTAILRICETVRVELHDAGVSGNEKARILESLQSIEEHMDVVASLFVRTHEESS